MKNTDSSPAATLDLHRLRATLRTSRIGRQVVRLPETTSTNDEAWAVAAALGPAAADGLVVLTDRQTTGRGRLGRTWHSPRGASVLLSVLLHDPAHRLSGGRLALLSAVAACDAVTATTDVHPRIKWPNDLVVGQRKLAGILIECRRDGDASITFVLGIGINCLQQRGHFEGELTGRATSLELESRQPIDRTAVAAALLNALERQLLALEAGATEELRRAWLARAEPLSQPIRLQQDGKLYEGCTLDVDPEAGLLVQLTEGGIRLFDAADTTVLPPAP
ncbi:MAG TPA: biotin--[acetyl-CoA-carboxylase] ligase [Phycisphaerae bacterium]|nr:biotin--[acetyl-CoA-carboxylase] ligase [Phycisphaerae bacterium]HNU46442.1 biotin--[acetyl-CoA-carboxylase] ligase [Phycisphaerae bacterium]